jgi:hypothetical protein
VCSTSTQRVAKLCRARIFVSAAKHIEHRMSVSIPTSITNHIVPAASCVACCLPPFLLVFLQLFFLRFAKALAR